LSEWGLQLVFRQSAGGVRVVGCSRLQSIAISLLVTVIDGIHTPISSHRCSMWFCTTESSPPKLRRRSSRDRSQDSSGPVDQWPNDAAGNQSPDTADAFSAALSRAGPMILAHTRAGRAAGFSAPGSTSSLPLLRTDSVSRGFCISLLILAIVVLADSLELFFFFIIPQC
jgi:hypothetical protein